MPSSLLVLGVVAVFLLIVFFSAVKVVQEYERGVVFRLGRLVGPRGPGLILLIPFVERMQKVDLRTVTMDIPAQEVITQDNVTVRVNAVAYFRVLDPNAAVVNVADFIRATSQIAQTTLRSVLGQSALDDLRITEPLAAFVPGLPQCPVEPIHRLIPAPLAGQREDGEGPVARQVGVARLVAGGGAVELVEAQKPPSHLDRSHSAGFPEPERGAIGPGTRRIEVEVDPGRSSRPRRRRLNVHGSPATCWSFP